MQAIDNVDAARRLARAIVSDIVIYNGEKILQGIDNDDLFDALAEEIEEGRALYKRRVSPDLYAFGYYERALVDSLFRDKAHIQCKLW